MTCRQPTSRWYSISVIKYNKLWVSGLAEECLIVECLFFQVESGCFSGILFLDVEIMQPTQCLFLFLLVVVEFLYEGFHCLRPCLSFQQVLHHKEEE